MMSIIAGISRSSYLSSCKRFVNSPVIPGAYGKKRLADSIDSISAEPSGRIRTPEA